MEFLNKVELKGIVGNVHTQTFGLHPSTRFSVVTEYASRDKDGKTTIEVTWFNCVTIPTENPLHGEIKKGDKIHLVGRLKSRNYTDQHNEPHYVFEVVVSSFEILSPDTSKE